MNWRKAAFFLIPMILFVLLAIFIEAGIMVGFEGWAYNETAERISPGLTVLMKGITHIGDPVVVITFCLFLFVVPKLRRVAALPVSVAVIFSALLNFALKNLFARERPDILRLINETGYSFPSGHSMINASLYAMLILLIIKYVKRVLRKVLFAVCCAALIVMIGISRIYLGVHYAGDVLGGWLVGFAISVIIFYFWHSPSNKFGVYRGQIQEMPEDQNEKDRP